jgi:DNA-binding MarR family transcriptional regulator
LAGEYQQAAELRSALRQFLRRSEEIARRNGLTPRQYLLLLMIGVKEDEPEQATITDLVDRMALTQSTVTELASQNDGRVMYLSLTPLGSNRLRAAWEEHGPERDRLLETLGAPLNV